MQLYNNCRTTKLQYIMIYSGAREKKVTDMRSQRVILVTTLT